MKPKVPDRAPMWLTRAADGLTLDVPDITPGRQAVLAAFGWSGHPARGHAIALGSPRWPSLSRAGVPGAGLDWRSRATDELRALHDHAVGRWMIGEFAPGSPTLLDVKIELARRLSSPCELCAIRCKADRSAGVPGRCGASNETRAFSFEILAAEEPGLGRGAAPRLAGCNADCVYCSRPDGIPASAGRPVATREVAGWIDDVADETETIHFIGGNVDQEIHFILGVISLVRRPRPVVWNHNATATPEALSLLNGVVDVYLPDLRYHKDECARATGATAMTFANCTAAIDAELAQGAIVCVRVLALPGHIACCTRPILEWLSSRREQLYVNLMGNGYMPLRFAQRYGCLGRRLTREESADLDSLAVSLDLRRVG